MKLYLFLLFILTISFESLGKPSSGGKGKSGAEGNNLYTEVGLGKPSSNITNPDGTIAYYSGLSAYGRGILPTFASHGFQLNLVATLKYLDLKNTSTATGIETSQQIGPGFGAELRYNAIVLGYDASVMKVRHQTTGVFPRAIEYNMTTNGSYIGIVKELNQLGIGVFLQQTTGEIGANDTGTGTAAPFKDEVYWLVLRYNMGASFMDLLKTL